MLGHHLGESDVDKAAKAAEAAKAAQNINRKMEIIGLLVKLAKGRCIVNTACRDLTQQN